MGRVLPSPDNVLKTAINVTRFGGLNTGEKRRILAIEMPSEERAKANPNLTCGAWSEWIHNLTAPEVKAPEGHTIRERKWFGNYICTGSEETIRENRADPDNCPICAYATHSEEFVPARYHAMNVIVYATRPGTYELVEPYSVQLLPWRFGERQLKQIADLWREHGDLQLKDLLIECTAKQYQNYEVQVGATAAWLDPRFNTGLQQGGTPKYGMDLRNLVLQTYRENKLTDPELASVIATRAGAATMREKAEGLARELGLGSGVMAAVGVTGASVATAEQAQAVMSPDDISAMLSQPSPGVVTTPAEQVAQATGRTSPAEVASEPQEPPISPDDLGVASAPPAPPEPQEAPPTTDPTNGAPPADDDVPVAAVPAQQVSLDDLLANG
jgi:hypothetical protein